MESLRLWVLSLKLRVFGSSNNFPPICFSICRTSCTHKQALFLSAPCTLTSKKSSNSCCCFARTICPAANLQPNLMSLQQDHYRFSLSISKCNNWVQYPPSVQWFCLIFPPHRYVCILNRIEGMRQQRGGIHVAYYIGETATHFWEWDCFPYCDTTKHSHTQTNQNGKAYMLLNAYKKI